MQFQPGQHIHITGIGGFGMSAIARVLLLRGFTVSGSDRGENALTAALMRDGATVYQGHDAAYIDGADMLLATSAVPDTHVELAAAQTAGIPVYRRDEIMAALLDGSRVFAVAGTHGKTTTTSMLVHILRETGRDPSYIVGGVMGNTGTNAGVGDSDLFVIEADEYGHMFLGLRPDVAVLTSVEWDHPDFFPSPVMLDDVFRRFLALLPDESGVLVYCADDSGAARLAAECDPVTRLSYGTDVDADLHAARIHTEGAVTRVALGDGVTLNLPLAGRHNVQNALGAMLAARQAGVALNDAAAALATFKTTGRRFDVRGIRDGVTVVDDYAHHPTAIKTTLEAARARYPGAAIWAVWQPHTFSRTQALLDDYATAFDAADHVRVTDIYAAREQPEPGGIDGAKAARAIRHTDSRHAGDVDATLKALLAEVCAPAVIMILSAGDAPRIADGYLAGGERQ